MYNRQEGIEKAKASYDLSIFYKDIDMDSSLVYAQEAKELSLSLKDYSLYSKSLKRLGVIYMFTEKPLKSQNYLERALRNAKDQKDTRIIADIQSDLGLLYQRQGSYQKSLVHLTKAYYYYLDKKPSPEKHKALNRLGILYLTTKKNDKSRKIYKEAIEVAAALGPKQEIASLINLAVLETQTGNYQASNLLYEEILKKELSKNITYQNKIKASYNNLAFNYYKMKKYQLSLEYANKCLEIPTAKLFDSQFSDTYRIVGNVHSALGNTKKAEKNLIKAVSIAEKNKFRESMIKAYQDLYRLYKKTANYKMALDYFEKYTVVKEGVNDENFSEEVVKIESSKVIEEKDVAYASLSKEKAEDKKQFKSNIERIIWISSIIFIIILGVISFFIFQNKTNLAENEKELSTIKLFALRSQMNPHFIFNTINGVQNFILKADKFEAYNYLSKFSKSIRLILDNSNTSFIRL